MGKNNLSGAWGESIAAAYLRKKHYKIIATNYRCRFGEIDLIATYKKTIIFVEVKTRKSADFALAREFVSNQKQSRLKATAEIYLSTFPTSLQPRFDVIEIYAPLGVQTTDPQIHHMEGAFE